jgi:alcohol dehydrogenase (quinone), cytochrome c subunit
MKLKKILQQGLLGAVALTSWHAQAADSVENATIARGAYLARAGDCVACHSVAGQSPFAGGLPIHSPMGVIYSTNITPDPVHGIGKYTEQQFARAMREGIRADGQHLYPAMPYPDYRAISDSDVHALYTYFMKGVQPVARKVPQTAMSFPFNQRWGMAAWNMMFTSDRPYTPVSSQTAEVNRGRYLVQTLGHCGSCHTPRGLAMHEKALTDTAPLYLAGGEVNRWATPSLRGMPSWSVEDIVEYLETGRNKFASVGGEMAAVVEHSTQFLSDADLRAMAVYLKALPADPAATAGLRPDAEAATARTVKALVDGRGLDRGAMVYLNTCQACHATDGNGAKGIFPRLNGARIVVQQDPTALIDVVLRGAQTPSTKKAPSVLPMPAFERHLNDQQVADLVTFLRSAWGNDASPVSARAIAAVRRETQK